MGASLYVERARAMAAYIEDEQATVSGDRNAARHTLERKYGMSPNALFRLKYRKPKQIGVDFFYSLCQAVEDAAQRQISRLENDIAKARACRVDIDLGAIGQAEASLKALKALAG